MTKQVLTGTDLITIIRAMADAICAEQDTLTGLDSALGDGDHGVNITTAMTAAAAAVAQLIDPTPADVLHTAGTALRDTMGGASGSVFGAFFRGGGRSVRAIDALSATDVGVMLAAGLAQMQKRGKAQPGDKTAVDALTPAIAAYERAVAEGCDLVEAVRSAAAQARDGAESTRAMVAQSGRAKFLGERSLGHQDAGATSIAIMFEAWAATLSAAINEVS